MSTVQRGRMPAGWAADLSDEYDWVPLRLPPDVTRLSASDASFYGLEDSSTPMYVGTLSILRKPRAGLSYETLLATVEARLPQIPRYRQKVREVVDTVKPGLYVHGHYHVRYTSGMYLPGGDSMKVVGLDRDNSTLADNCYFLSGPGERVVAV